MKRAFCTVITSSYIPFAKTLFKSIKVFDPNVKTFALVVDKKGCSEFDEFDEFNILYIENLSYIFLSKEISKKYANNTNALRWSLKSVLMIHLLQTSKYNQVFFVDPDLFFYSDFKFLYEELAENSFILSPHWYCMDPNKSEVEFCRLMTDGLYNAGFLGATIKGLETLYWWAKMCFHSCYIDYQKGLFVDQGFLNLLPLKNPDSKLIHHRGCNVAPWNSFESRRSLSPNGELLLNNVYPLVFIHFTDLPKLIEHDPLLIPFLERYEIELRNNGFEGSLISSSINFINRQRLRNLSLLERFLIKIIGKDWFAKLKKWNK